MNSRPGREPELLLLIVLGAMAVVAAAWVALELPTPRCLFHDLTSIPCLGCGGSRCVRSLFRGDIAAALGWNPLVFSTMVGCGMVGLYSLAVVCGRMPPIRIGGLSKPHAGILRAAIAAALVANWIYLISRGI